MARAMVVTVGTGTRADSNIVVPLVKSIRHVSPERVVLLVTESTNGSRSNGETIRRRTEGSRTQTTLTSIPDLDDLEQTFLCCLAALRGLEHEGFAPGDIVVEYTSGTKAMTAGLALAATSFGCESLNYVTGRREHGVVVAGTEKLLSVPTTFFRAHHDLEIARHLFERLQFSAVLELLPEWRVHLLGDEDGATLFALRALAHAYDAWDKFAHADFVQCYALVRTALQPDTVDKRVRAYASDERIVLRVQGMSQAIKKEDPRQRFLADHLADLWNNAWRRANAGQFDDAVARLYRLVEMTAQFELGRTFGATTSNIRLDRLPGQLGDDFRAELEQKRSTDSRSRIRLGLQDSYRLLRELNSPLGLAHTPGADLDELLKQRNGSILAHGQAAIDHDVATRLLAESARLAAVVVPDFEQRVRELQFPWLRDRTTSSDEAPGA